MKMDHYFEPPSFSEWSHLIDQHERDQARIKELQDQLSHFMPSNPEGPLGYPWHLPHYDVMWADNERYKDALHTLLNYYSTLGPEAKEAKLLIEDALRDRIYTCPIDLHRKL